MKIVRHLINQKTGQVQIQVIGMQGPGCQALTKPIEDGLGLVTKEEVTDEYYQVPVETVTQEN